MARWCCTSRPKPRPAARWRWCKTGDIIELDVPARKLHLDVSDAELAKRRAAWVAPEPPKRGYYKLYVEHVQQADKGADLDFLVGGSGTDRHPRLVIEGWRAAGKRRSEAVGVREFFGLAPLAGAATFDRS